MYNAHVCGVFLDNILVVATFALPAAAEHGTLHIMALGIQRSASFEFSVALALGLGIR